MSRPSHPGITPADLAKLPNNGQGVGTRRVEVPWARLIRRDGARHARLLLLRLDAVDVSQLAAARTSSTNTTCSSRGRRSSRRPSSWRASAATISAACISDRILAHDGRPPQSQARLRHRRASSRSFLFMLPVFLTHNLTIDRAQPGGGVLLRRARHRPDVVDSDGHRAEVFRHGERADEHRIGRRRHPVAASRSATSSTGPATGSCRSSARWACCCVGARWRSRCTPSARSRPNSGLVARSP